ncbi:MAG: tRNA (adenosine(37)-N6)-threonylcarbamoyltransferase complex dimerization subunit type 1 TsaB [Bifidobacterium sp.]|nr:tRNA (adenosine(37)-N6)-threonylcarbamoyltransferase complex dimerization subunit type 1 TsaB [Bifidobacterium sp.]
MSGSDTPLLVIDTSYGSTVGLPGREPCIETDSRSHVERLQVNIAKVMDQAGLSADDLRTIVVGLGPAPFTGLRAGIVTAKALAFATGARLLGQDVLEPQARYAYSRFKQQDQDRSRLLVLAVNDARRRQLYYRLFDDFGDVEAPARPLTEMSIDYPAAICEKIAAVVEESESVDPRPVTLVVSGHGAGRYADQWQRPDKHPGIRVVLDEGSFLEDRTRGTGLMAACACRRAQRGLIDPVEPLYLRRPDVSVPNPLKHVAVQS